MMTDPTVEEQRCCMSLFLVYFLLSSPLCRPAPDGIVLSVTGIFLYIISALKTQVKGYFFRGSCRPVATKPGPVGPAPLPVLSEVTELTPTGAENPQRIRQGRLPRRCRS